MSLSPNAQGAAMPTPPLTPASASSKFPFSSSTADQGVPGTPHSHTSTSPTADQLARAVAAARSQQRRAWRVIVRHVESNDACAKHAPKCFGEDYTYSLKLNESSVNLKKTYSRRLIFDEGVDILEAEKDRVEVKLTWSTKAQSTSHAHADGQFGTYRASFTREESLDDEASQTVEMVLQSGEPAVRGATKLRLVLWCFTGFFPCKDSGKRLSATQIPSGHSINIDTLERTFLQEAWTRFKPLLYKLPDILLQLDRFMAPLAGLHPVAQAAYGLVTVAIGFASDKIKQHELAKGLVDDMVDVIDFIQHDVPQHFATLQEAMKEGFLAVENAALWLLRYGESTFVQRHLSWSVAPKLYDHMAELAKSKRKLRDRSICTLAEIAFKQQFNSKKERFTIAPRSKIRVGGFEELRSPGCAPGTRLKTLKEIDDWLHNTNSPNFLLLEAAMGLGKSSVTEELVKRYPPEKELLADFRFKLPESAQDKPQNVEYLALSLARQIFDIESAVEPLVARDTYRDGREPLDTFQILICSLPARFEGLGSRRLILIDGIDDSAVPKEVMVALTEWIKSKPQAFKVLITGRDFSPLLDRLKDRGLVQQQYLRSDDVGLEGIVQRLCTRYVDVDTSTHSRLTDAAEELPLWVARAFEHILRVDEEESRVETCRSVVMDKTLLDNDFARCLNSAFPVAPTTDASANKLLQAFHAIVNFLQSGAERASKSLLLAMFGHLWIADALRRLKPLLKGGGAREDDLKVIHTSFFTFLSGQVVPVRFYIKVHTHVSLTRRCFLILRKDLRPLEFPQEAPDIRVEYAVKHWPRHWLAAMNEDEHAFEPDGIRLLHDFIKGRDSIDGQLKRDDPRAPVSLQRGGFASWAELYHKLQCSQDDNALSPAWSIARNVRRACARIPQEPLMLSIVADYCMGVLDTFSTLSRGLEQGDLQRLDNQGERCSSNESTNLWISLLAAAPRPSDFYFQFSAQRRSLTQVSQASKEL